MTAQDPADIIAVLWERFRPTVAERLDAISAGAEAIADGATAGDPRVRDAHRAAHNLAGALGSYGRPDGSVVARRLMGLLDEPRPRHDAVVGELETLRGHCA
ncbi:Hpt domain-containing protein [Demequina zhanjiangensis]|uniref:Hpt domain-containing protein n=1 Tax=Demequina zhanjiangensis TaxID=3051659 RepID=A0ABT8FZD8_9MICO|nr:Hpt domain-containing protein [Demequina sp. SYSU T00b26]MDN4472260.1 Hpt domain-containing protein [Demequina sp. SYSU T00b26]